MRFFYFLLILCLVMLLGCGTTIDENSTRLIASVEQIDSESVTVYLLIEQGEVDDIHIQAFGLNVEYPYNLLDYVGFEVANTLVEEWYAAQAQENLKGKIIIGGFDNTHLIDGSGLLFTLKFHIKDTGTGTIELGHFVDDIREFKAVNGDFELVSM